MSTAFFSGLASSTLVRAMGLVTVAAGLFPMLSSLFVKVVQEGECGVYMRGGKVRILKDGQVKLALPGTHRTVPIFRTIMLVSVKDQPADVPRQTFHLKDGTQVFLDSAVVYRRKLSGKAMRRSLLGVDNLEQAIVNLIGDSLMSVGSGMMWDADAVGESIARAALVHSKLRARKMYGTIMSDVLVTGFGKTEAQLRLDGMNTLADAVRQSDPTPSRLPGPLLEAVND